MRSLFSEEVELEENRQRANFVFLAYPFMPALPADEYREAMESVQDELPVRMWYFLDEVTTVELMRKIWRAILRADLALFDTSRGNPNVAFELGLAVSAGARCVPVLKTGEPNPLGTADLGYSERVEYDSRDSLRTKVRNLVLSQCSGIAAVRGACNEVLAGRAQAEREELFGKSLQIVSGAFRNLAIQRGMVDAILGDRLLSKKVLLALQKASVLRLDGDGRGARYVLGADWVGRGHDVRGG